ncbi:hypothetical protein MATL_G00135270 [Megalops atlanticus]|uniref:Uncharacterized protein n=1 Tax=Megalops atlanticus TaxID=7932 RepID=A0A9D3PZF9_MEGAT|nr:hypothetical protein MATL_G00135270 [Megalops atlanticus]
MRRSGAPSQLNGNLAKRPRFVPPGATLTSLPPRPEPQALPPQLTPCNTLSKVRNALSEKEERKKDEAPVPSKALARILNAVPQRESKENCTELQGLTSLPCEEACPPEDRASTDHPDHIQHSANSECLQ